MSTEVKLETIVSAIVKQTGLTSDEVMERVDTAINAVNGLLTKIGAALVLADKMHVKLDAGDPGTTLLDDGEQGLKIGQLVEGMKSINVSGKVTNAFPVNEFTRKDGKKGRVLNMIIRDDSGSARVAFWDEMAGKVADVKPGTTLKLINVYTKKGYKDKGIDINVGYRSTVVIDPDDVDDADFKTPVVTINAVTSKMKYCSMSVTVYKKIEPKEFHRKDGNTGTIAKVRVEDDEGTRATVIFWTESIDDYDAIEENKAYEFKELGVKFNDFRDEFEFHVNKGTVISAVKA